MRIYLFSFLRPTYKLILQNNFYHNTYIIPLQQNIKLYITIIVVNTDYKNIMIPVHLYTQSYMNIQFIF